MTKITANELNLATGMVRWFSTGSSETSILSLGRAFGIDDKVILDWASSEEYLWFADDDSVSLSVVPFIWRDFAPDSRLCYVLYEAFLELRATEPKVDSWSRSCANDSCLHTKEPENRYADVEDAR